MEQIIKKLSNLTDAWNDYFLEYNFCQSKINFDAEVRRNYYGDIYHYFDDTISVFIDINYEDDFQKSIFQAIGLLQIIYSHQDLVDELLYIFKLPESDSYDKSDNRLIRNEVVGHPIRRNVKDGALISSVFFTAQFSGGKISYLRYAVENNFSGEIITHNIDEIIERHKEFLIKYLDIIWKKVNRVLLEFKEMLTDFRNLLDRNLAFEDILKMCTFRFNTAFESYHLFKQGLLEECYKRKSEHFRYFYASESFIEGLKDSIPDTIRALNRFLGSVNGVMMTPSYFDDITIQAVREHQTIERANKKDLHYEFSKLSEKDKVFGMDYFINFFQNDEHVTMELMNMKQNANEEVEYYSSLHYLKKLLSERGYLK